MGRFAHRDLAMEADEPDTYDPAVDCWCAVCGIQFNGSDSSGGHHTGPPPHGCCQSFASLSGFDRHRVGKHGTGDRRCLTPEEMRAKGWTVDDNRVWRLPAPKTSPWAKFMTQPRRAEVRSRNKRFDEGWQPFQTSRWSDPVADPIPFVPPAPSKLDDQTILDEFWRRGLLARFAADTLTAEFESRGFTVTLHNAAPKYVTELRELLAKFYGEGQVWSPSGVAAFMVKQGITSTTGSPPNLHSALAYLIQHGEVVKHSGSHYEWVHA